MRWWKPSYCFDYFQSVWLVRDQPDERGRMLQHTVLAHKMCCWFLYPFFSNNLYRVMAREGTLLIILITPPSLETQDGGLVGAKHHPLFWVLSTRGLVYSPPLTHILPMQTLCLDFWVIDGLVTSTPPLCCLKHIREGRSASAHPLFHFLSDEGHTPPLPCSKQETDGLFCQSLLSQFLSNTRLF